VSDFLRLGRRKTPSPDGTTASSSKNGQSSAPNLTINVTDGTLIPGAGEKSILSAWNISFFGAIALMVALPIISPKPYLDILSFVPDGLVATFGVTLASIFFALILGLLAGLGRIAKTKSINLIATVYVEVIRGIPLLVQLFYIYYALGPLLHMKGPTSAIMAMSICYGAYMGEIFRAGIQSIPKGQMEAALALGMTRTQALWRVILPQTIKVILPPIGNEFIALLKDSSLVSILAVSDLLRRGREYASTTFYYFQAYTIIALIYLVMTLFFSRLVGLMETRLRNHGRQSY
jgi:amine acid ABC transporter, permease protein, 3-TM region, His/Glu/Gln/Arg/opine family